MSNKVKVSLCVLVVASFFMSLIGCAMIERQPIDSDTAAEYISELQYYVEKTGDTDIYQWFEDDMGYDYHKYIASSYSLYDILDYIEENYQEDYFEYLRDRFDYVPNMSLIMEEIDYQEFYEEYEYLFELADKIGYSPSAIVGTHCLQTSTRIIHLTDSDCLSNIDFSDMCFFCEDYKKDLVAEINDGDSYLQNCTLCKKCYPN